MYRILIADDEGLMLEAFKGVILAEFGDKCSVETAKTGRAVIEKAETFHPEQSSEQPDWILLISFPFFSPFITKRKFLKIFAFSLWNNW